MDIDIYHMHNLLRSMAYLDGVLLVRVGAYHEGVADKPLSYYTTADAFAFPLLAEGFRLSCFKSILRGTPVVTTDRPPMNEITSIGRFVKDPLDPVGLAEALSRIIRDAGKIVEGYVQLREKFSIGRFVCELEDSIKSAAEAASQ